MVLRSFTCWKVRAMPARAIWRCARRLMSLAEKAELGPGSGGSAPVIRLNIVVLPAPLGPIRPRISPALTSKLTLSTATRPPKRRVAPATVRIGWPRSGLLAGARASPAARGGGGLHGGSQRSAKGTMPARARCSSRMNSTENTMTSSWPEAPGEITGSQSWMLFLSRVTTAAPTIAPEQVGHAADHRHQQEEDADIDVEGRRADEAAHVGVEPARQRRQQGRDDEGDELHAERIDAQALGRMTRPPRSARTARPSRESSRFADSTRGTIRKTQIR